MASDKTLNPKPDAMASMAPAHALRPVSADNPNGPTPGIDMGLPYYNENINGQILDASLYITQDASKDYRFCTTNPRFGSQIRKNKGFVATKDSDGKEVNVAGMQLCERPAAYKQYHDDRIKSRTLEQARKHSAKAVRQDAAARSGVDPDLISASERQTVESV